MATFHSGSEGQTQKLQALRRRQKRLAFRAVIVPPVCWGICAASAPWWFPPRKETLGVRFDAQTQGWILLALMLLMISLPVLISLHLKRRARGAKYAATLVSSGIRGEEDARDDELSIADSFQNFFEHNTPLHDGAVIIRGNRIVSATCYLPLTDSMDIGKELGTRHRAAVGISEVSDSLTIIVSEETGAVSLAKDGRLYKHLQKEELVEKLQQLKVDDTGNADVFKKWKDLLRNEKSEK